MWEHPLGLNDRSRTRTALNAWTRLCAVNGLSQGEKSEPGRNGRSSGISVSALNPSLGTTLNFPAGQHSVSEQISISFEECFPPAASTSSKYKSHWQTYQRLPSHKLSETSGGTEVRRFSINIARKPSVRRQMGVGCRPRILCRGIVFGDLLS